MGDAAEMILDGSMCESCGTLFKKAHGYPVTCRSCWRTLTPDQRAQHQRATNKEY